MNREKTIGTIEWRPRPAEVKIKVHLGEKWGERDTQRRLSISGMIWRKGAWDCDSGGQINSTLKNAKWVGSPTLDVGKLLEIWGRWHRNDMHAGCEHQRAEKWEELPLLPDKPTSSYVEWTTIQGRKTHSWNMRTWARRDEHPEGLMCEPCPTCGYRYGTKWVKEELSEEALAWAREFIGEEET
jgi:hypothetical protein